MTAELAYVRPDKLKEFIHDSEFPALNDEKFMVMQRAVKDWSEREPAWRGRLIHAFANGERRHDAAGVVVEYEVTVILGMP